MFAVSIDNRFRLWLASKTSDGIESFKPRLIVTERTMENIYVSQRQPIVSTSRTQDLSKGREPKPYQRHYDNIIVKPRISSDISHD